MSDKNETKSKQEKQADMLRQNLMLRKKQLEERNRLAYAAARNEKSDADNGDKA